MKVTIIGLGLIGGSIARSLKRSGDVCITAVDNNEQVLLDAVSLGVIDRKASVYDLEDSDVVYLCLYPDAALEFTEKNKNRFGKNTVLTDVCGIKTYIYPKLKAIADEAGFTYIGSHPMAGKEQSGFSASDASLFYGASYIIVDNGENNEAVGILKELALRMGFGKIVFATSDEHDKAIAYTSQLPHVLACAYVLSPMCSKHDGFSAGSYRDVSRVADINAKLWTELFISNKESLTDEIDTLIKNMEAFKSLIKEGNAEELKAVLQNAGDNKRKYG
ncbi:MAG: prephenate dehydrogenase [Ruminococcaceae bacterium]|nr:prephenate dehydrogenase [Oscillospiraceae bacterium]